MRTSVLVFAFVMLLPVSDSAKDKNGGFVTLGVGTKSCAVWVSDHGGNDVEQFMLDGWLTGYLTGFNEFVSSTGDITNGTDFEDIQGWMNNYCAANPLTDLSTASEELLTELIERRKTHE